MDAPSRPFIWHGWTFDAVDGLDQEMASFLSLHAFHGVYNGRRRRTGRTARPDIWQTLGTRGPPSLHPSSTSPTLLYFQPRLAKSALPQVPCTPPRKTVPVHGHHPPTPSPPFTSTTKRRWWYFSLATITLALTGWTYASASMASTREPLSVFPISVAVYNRIPPSAPFQHIVAYVAGDCASSVQGR
jgi:hypothetical protein